MGSVLTFLQSDLGAVVVAGVVSLWRYLKRREDRAGRAAEYFGELFEVVEIAARVDPGFKRLLDEAKSADERGELKYRRFIQEWMTARTAAGLGTPSGREMAVAREWARRRAMLRK